MSELDDSTITYKIRHTFSVATTTRRCAYCGGTFETSNTKRRKCATCYDATMVDLNSVLMLPGGDIVGCAFDYYREPPA